MTRIISEKYYINSNVAIYLKLHNERALLFHTDQINENLQSLL